jgi:hypothetical protein
MKTIKIGIELKEIKDKDKREFTITHSDEVTVNEALGFTLEIIKNEQLNGNL